MAPKGSRPIVLWCQSPSVPWNHGPRGLRPQRVLGPWYRGPTVLQPRSSSVSSHFGARGLKGSRPAADTLGQEGLTMRSMAFVSEKGGAGKRTTVLNVAGAMARKGIRVLVGATHPPTNASYGL